MCYLLWLDKCVNARKVYLTVSLFFIINIQNMFDKMSIKGYYLLIVK